tara:strand:- start:1166 stop:1336 length:171 start_codon:yes stop_codon:yes gene_type:complete
VRQTAIAGDTVVIQPPFTELEKARKGNAVDWENRDTWFVEVYSVTLRELPLTAIVP